LFEKGEIPVIVFGILFAMLFIFGGVSTPLSTLNTETIPTLFNGQRTISDGVTWIAMATSRCRQWTRWRY
jgi:hypothetical protein